MNGLRGLEGPDRPNIEKAHKQRIPRDLNEAAVRASMLYRSGRGPEARKEIFAELGASVPKGSVARSCPRSTHTLLATVP